MNSRLPVQPITSTSIDIEEFKESQQQAIWHVLVLNVFSGLAYSLIWFYRTWRNLKAHAEQKFQAAENLSGTDFELRHFLKTSPFLRTAGIVVPGLQFYFLFVLFLNIARLHPAPTSLAQRHPRLMATLLTLPFVSAIFLAKLPGAWYLLFVTAAIPLVIAQHWLNAYWRSQESGKVIIRQAFNTLELVVLIIGAAVLGLIVTGYAVGL